MKKKIPLLGMYLLTFLIVCVVTFLTCACNGRAQWAKPESTVTQSDSMLVAQYVDRIVNPEFLTVKEVFEFRSKTVENAQVDSLILALPENILMNVATVVINKFGTATKRQIYDEYRANISVYENLPNNTSDTSNNAKNTASTDVEDPPTGVDKAVIEQVPSTTAYNFRDTVINGKKTRIETKTITYE